METQFTVCVIFITLAIAVGVVLRHRRTFCVKKMISAALRSDEYVILHYIEKGKPSYFGYEYDVLISNQDNVKLIYHLYVYEGGGSHEIVSIMCTGFRSYVIVYNDGEVCTETLPGFNMNFEDCEEILALARSAFQQALHTYQAK